MGEVSRGEGMWEGEVLQSRMPDDKIVEVRFNVHKVMQTDDRRHPRNHRQPESGINPTPKTLNTGDRPGAWEYILVYMNSRKQDISQSNRKCDCLLSITC